MKSTDSSRKAGVPGTMMRGPGASVQRTLEGTLWFVIAASVAIGLFGYGFFTLRPENLARWPSVAGWHAAAMIVGAQFQSLACVGLMFVRAGAQWGWSLALRLCLGLSLIGFLAEWVGTSTGFPFGSYHYTDMLGYKLDGLVPWVIPPSWFAMGIPSYALAAAAVRRVLGMGVGSRSGSRPLLCAWLRVVLGGWLLMTWDLVLDPAMSHLLPYWQWQVEGFFYASPFVNFVGWFGVGTIIMAVLEWGSLPRLAPEIPAGWALGFYGLNLSMSAGMCLLAGEVLPLAVCLASVLTGWGALLFASGLVRRLSAPGSLTTRWPSGHVQPDGGDTQGGVAANSDDVGRNQQEAWP